MYSKQISVTVFFFHSVLAYNRARARAEVQPYNLMVFHEVFFYIINCLICTHDAIEIVFRYDFKHLQKSTEKIIYYYVLIL